MPTQVTPQMPRLRAEAGRFLVDVAWDDVDELRDLLRSRDIGSTAHLDPLTHAAHLELWDAADSDRVREVLAGWHR